MVIIVIRLIINAQFVVTQMIIKMDSENKIQELEGDIVDLKFDSKQSKDKEII